MATSTCEQAGQSPYISSCCCNWIDDQLTPIFLPGHLAINPLSSCNSMVDKQYGQEKVCGEVDVGAEALLVIVERIPCSRRVREILSDMAGLLV